MFNDFIVKFARLAFIYGILMWACSGCIKSGVVSISDSSYLKKIYVNAQSASAQPDGKTWDQAFKTISQAINTINEDGTTIYVAAGSYQETIDLKDKKNIKLVGGCRVLTDCSERSKDEWTTLDGTNLPKNFHLINITGDAHDIEIASGFILTGMKNEGSAINIKGTVGKLIKGITVAHSKILKNEKEDKWEIGHGAGVYIEHAELIKIIDLTFLENKASSSGGAIYASNVNNIEIIKSNFADNQAIYGGGVHLQNIQGQVIFDKVDFRYNLAWGKVSNGVGGAIYLSQISLPAQVIIRNCSFVENYGRIFGGAINSSIDATVDIKDAIFDKNKAGFGGAIYLNTGSKFMIGPGVKFTNNISEGPDGGGAVFAAFDDGSRGELSFANQASDLLGNTSKSGKGNFLTILTGSLSTKVENLVKMGTLGISLLDTSMIHIKRSHLRN